MSPTCCTHPAGFEQEKGCQRERAGEGEDGRGAGATRHQARVGQCVDGRDDHVDDV